MRIDFVPYEQALKLKELEFDGMCLAYYNPEFNLSKLPVNFNYQSKYGDPLISAPLFQQAFRWLRDEYDYHRHICYIEEENIGWCGDVYDVSRGWLLNDPNELNGYKTYEEAELACLIKILDLLEDRFEKQKENPPFGGGNR